MAGSRAVALLALAALLAGCSGTGSTDNAATPEPEGVDEVDGPRTTEGGASSDLRVLDHKDSYQLDNAMPATTMVVPANVSSLRAQLTTSSVGPCGAVVGEPDDPLGPRVVFTSPSGATTTLDANAQQCRVGPVAGPPVVAMDEFAAEAGDWQVTFYGRSLGVMVHLIVDCA